jgi:tetratricopeptide (TPR) repeat protein
MLAQHLLGRSLRLLAEGMGGRGRSGLFYFRNATADQTALPFLQRALTAQQAALASVNPKERPQDWVIIQNEIGNTLFDIGGILQFAGTQYYQSAISAHQAALGILTKESNPMEWVRTHLYLSEVFGSSAMYSKDSDKLFQKAVTEKEFVLEVFTKEASPDLWATAQSELGETLAMYGTMLTIEKKPDSTEILKRAIEAFNNALTIHNASTASEDWASDESGLGRALSELGKSIPGEEGNKYIRRGIDAIRNSQTIFTKETHPSEWCSSQNRLLQAQEALWRRGDRAHAKWSGVSILNCH